MEEPQVVNRHTVKDILSRLNTEKIRQMQTVLDPNKEENNIEKIEAVEALFDYAEEYVYKRTPEEKQILDELVRNIYEVEIRDVEEAFMEKIGKIPLYLGDEVGDLKPSVAGQYEYGTCIRVNTNELYRPLSSTIMENRLKGCKEIIHTIFHEIQHHKQYIMATSTISTKEGMDFAKEMAVMDVMQREYYKGIYNESIIENNAEKEAEKTTMERIGNTKEEEQKMLYHILVQDIGPYEVNNVETYDGRRIYNMVKQEKGEVIDKILDDAIVKDGRLDLLDKYTMLQKKYNAGGEKRRVKQLIRKMKEEREEYIENLYLTSEEVERGIENLEDMYLDLIYKQLEETTPEELKEINKDDLQEVLNKMEAKFEEKAQVMIMTQERNIQISEELQPELKPWQLIKKMQRRQQENEPKLYAKQRLKEQKRFIKGVRKGKIPKKMSKIETQALQTITPFKRRMAQIGNTMKTGIINVKDGVKGYLKKFFKPQKKPFNLESRKIEIPEEHKIKIKEEATEKLNDEKSFKEELKVEKKGTLSNIQSIETNKEQEKTINDQQEER